jgi:uncharacterized protein
VPNAFAKRTLNRIRQKPGRGHYDKQTIYSIVDEALVCHVGMVDDGRPVVIPMIHARDADLLYLHGSPVSRLMRYIGAGNHLCVEVTLLDGIVFARSAFHHSLNYRSAVLFGPGASVDAYDEKLHAAELLTEHVARGRWQDSRKPTHGELKATAIVRMRIVDASAKIRTGPPVDDRDDYQLPVWAGTLPLGLQPLTPEPDPGLAHDVAIPEYVKRYQRIGVR